MRTSLFPLKRSVRYLLAILFIAAPILFSHMNCSPTLEAEGPTKTLRSASSLKVTVVPATATVAPNGSQSFQATGGGKPYVFNISPGVGTIDSMSGFFQAQAGVTTGTATVSVTDSYGDTAYAVVTISAVGGGAGSISSTYSPNPATTNATVTITPTSGVAPYTYAVISGGGVLTGNSYKAPSAPTSVTIEITDATGAKGSLNFSVAQAACAGVSIGGACWYLGGSGQSCDTVCGSRGGYNAATATYAGQAGSNANCSAVLTALMPKSGVNDYTGAIVESSCTLFGQATASSAAGCFYSTNRMTGYRCSSLATTSAAASTGVLRACACNN